MAGCLKGKVALVTAAAQGFGRAIAEAFINQSATLIATDVDAKKLKGLAAAQNRAVRRSSVSPGHGSEPRRKWRRWRCYWPPSSLGHRPSASR
jgi:NAD(P)-dependent dehydrogenase (short-subunit alcohol dehydrogenase family)